MTRASLVPPRRLVDLPVGVSASQPKADGGGLVIHRHFPAQTSGTVFLFLAGRPAAATNGEGTAACTTFGS